MASSPSSKPKPTGVVQKLEKRAEELAKRVEELEKELDASDFRALYFEHLLRTAEKQTHLGHFQSLTRSSHGLISTLKGSYRLQIGLSLLTKSIYTN